MAGRFLSFWGVESLSSRGYEQNTVAGGVRAFLSYSLSPEPWSTPAGHENAGPVLRTWHVLTTGKMISLPLSPFSLCPPLSFFILQLCVM